jgi:hypothetical protein
MIAALKHLADGLLGRGEASITVPPFDGQLKPNQLLETASVIAELDAPEDLATDGEAVLVANAEAVLRLGPREPVEIARFERTVTALCCLRDGGVAVALEGSELRLFGGAHDGKRWDTLAGRPLVAVNALTPSADGSGVLVTDGSSAQPYERWHHDLMARGHSGRLVMLDLNGGSEREIATGLAYAFGACAAGPAVWVSESWRHRL